jgi:CubicO group peptidase (beta-lactamase class C family)
MLASDHYVKYALEIPMAVQPDTEFAYCSPGVHLLSEMIAKATGASALEFANENLFGLLGIPSTSMEMATATYGGFSAALAAAFTNF